jgi:N4-gp56 family major capsid protein
MASDNLTTGLTTHMSTYYDKVFLERAELMLVYSVGAQVKQLGRNMGKTVVWNRMTPLAVATTPLTEGTTPTGVAMSTTSVSATVAEYGNWTQTSNFYELTSIDPGLREEVEVMGQNAGETIDTLIKNELDGGGTAQVVNSLLVSAVTATDIIDGIEIRKAVRTLKLNKAMKFEDGNYRAIIPVSVSADLRGDSEWLDAHRYVTPENIKNGEIGRLHGVTFFETNNEMVGTDDGSGNVDIYSTFVFGKNAYGTVDLAGQMGPRVIVKTPGANDTANPLDLYQTVGWKAHFAVKVLNSSWVIELKTASSFGTN